MARLLNFLMLTAILGIIAFGCGEQPNPVDSNNLTVSGLPEGQKITIPAGAVFESATLHIYVHGFDGTESRSIEVHRITDGWDEGTVTWNSFGSSYSSVVEASFDVTAPGWVTVDITTLVGGWLNESYNDYGLLLANFDVASGRTYFRSREYVSPYLEVTYSTTGGVETIYDNPIGDTYITALYPDDNYGSAPNLFVGIIRDYLKQTLIQFDFDTTPELAEIGDTVWFDNNRDGIQDADEPGFPNVMVELYNCDDVLLGTTMTNADGFYIFSGLTPGDYYVKFIRPEGYVFTLQNVGDDANDSDADPITGLDVCTNLEGGESDMTHDAGLHLRDMEGCTLTIGFWKNHAGFGPQDDVLSQFLPIWLGTEGGAKSMYVDNAAMAVDILKMKTYGKPSNGITKLYAQMLGAKLNMMAGADYSAIADAMADADAFLADYDWTDWNKKMKFVINWMSTFDDYNNGYIGPGHCDDFGDDD